MWCKILSSLCSEMIAVESLIIHCDAISMFFKLVCYLLTLIQEQFSSESFRNNIYLFTYFHCFHCFHCCMGCPRIAHVFLSSSSEWVILTCVSVGSLLKQTEKNTGGLFILYDDQQITPLFTNNPTLEIVNLCTSSNKQPSHWHSHMTCQQLLFSRKTSTFAFSLYLFFN